MCDSDAYRYSVMQPDHNLYNPQAPALKEWSGHYNFLL